MNISGVGRQPVAGRVAALRLDREGQARLLRLATAFSRACNFVVAIARQHGCFSRVALHHLAYRPLREAQPELGAQMACNAIHAVCRACIAVYLHPDYPWNPRLPEPAPLPHIAFSARAPVYFDQHTLSLRGTRASLYTLEGRLHCELQLSAGLQQRLGAERLVQTLLMATDQGFVLEFCFEANVPARPRNRPRPAASEGAALARHLQIVLPPERPPATALGPAA